MAGIRRRTNKWTWQKTVVASRQLLCVWRAAAVLAAQQLQLAVCVLQLLQCVQAVQQLLCATVRHAVQLQLLCVYDQLDSSCCACTRRTAAAVRAACCACCVLLCVRQRAVCVLCAAVQRVGQLLCSCSRKPPPRGV